MDRHLLQHIRLEELSDGVEDGGNTSRGDGARVDNGGTGGGTAGARGAGAGRAGARLAVGGGRVVLLGITVVLAVDDVVLHLVEGVAVELAVSRLQVEATRDLLKGTELDTGKEVSECEIERCQNDPKNSRVELAAEVNSSSDTLKLGEVDLLELVVTGNLETTVDLLKAGHGDVGQLLVVHEDKVTSAGQVGGNEALKVSAVETEGAGQLLEGGNGDAADVTASQVLAIAEVGEFNLESVVVGSEGDVTSGVLQVVDVDGLEVTVVLNVESTDGLEGDTVQGAQLGVIDVDITSGGDTGVEAERLESGQNLEVQGAHGVQLGESQVGEGGQTGQLEGTGDLGDGVGGEGGELGSVVDSQVTIDLLDTGERQGAGEVRGDGDVTLDSGARVEAIGITLGFDLGVTA